MRVFCALIALALAVTLASARPAACAEVTDEHVQRAIEKGREYLINLRNPDGSFTQGEWRSCYSALILMTLAHLGEHPNRDVMSSGMQYLLNLDPDRDLGKREGYALPIRVMALAYLHNRLTDDRRALARKVVEAAKIAKAEPKRAAAMLSAPKPHVSQSIVCLDSPALFQGRGGNP